jgi:hypothetical protein
MSKLNSDIYINSETSKIVLNSIIEGKKINFKKLKIELLKKDVNNLKKQYLDIKNNNHYDNKDFGYRYFLFWELVKKKYNKDIISLEKRPQKKRKKVNIIFSNIGKCLGYNPSLLSLLIFYKEIGNILKYDNFFKDLEKYADLETISSKKKIIVINKIFKGKIKIITPLCPDYEHVKIAFGLYKYTFNKLNEDVGLIGSRLIKIIEKMHTIFDKYKIKFDHNLYYGDFEAYSAKIQERTKETEHSFVLKVKKSCLKMNRIIKPKAKAFLLIKSLSSKKNFLEICKKNEIKIIKKMSKDNYFKRQISEITSSRSALYSSWFPNNNENEYKKLVIQQGAEYAAMGYLFKKKFNNSIIIGLDHPKMGIFYNIFDDNIALYGRPKYA